MSTVEPNFGIGVSYVDTFPRPIVEELCDDLERTGAQILVEKRQAPGILAAVDWLIPTAIIIFLGNKFFGTILQETAKDVYPVLKESFLKVIRLTCGPSKKIIIRQIASAPMKISKETTPAFSITAQLKLGCMARFTFDEDLEDAYHLAALDTLFSTLSDHYRYHPSDPLTKAIERMEAGGRREVHMKYDSAENAWEVVNIREEIISRSQVRAAELKRLAPP